MFRDRLVFWFFMFLLLVFLAVYYVGESRNRRLRELGFKICEINGIQTWSTSCPEKK